MVIPCICYAADTLQSSVPFCCYATADRGFILVKRIRLV